MTTAEQATRYTNRMVAIEADGWGDTSNAIRRIANRSNIPFWTLNNIKRGRAKTVEAGIFDRIRGALLDVYERQIESLKHEIALEKALGTDDTLEALEAEVEALAFRIRTKKRALMR